MANVTDVLLRSQAIYKKYEKYDTNAATREKTDDPFMDELNMVADRVQDLQLRSDEIANEKNRALKAALNAELRKTKAMLLEQAIPLLEKMAKKGKGQTPEKIQARLGLVEELRQSIEAVADGVTSARKPQRAFTGSPARGGELTINPAEVDGRSGSTDYYKHTDDTRAFQQEWSEAKARQDQQLEGIETGLGHLKEIGAAMNEELQRHDILITEVDEKMDKVTKELQTNNMRLTGLVTKMRSTRNFIVDIVLLCIILAIGLYLYTFLK
ncbi:Qc-SNARE SYP7-family [Micractinium conductrix]|uniref:Qc-SNARE SYP7-family n=1 Tax=Micractinium conductrix TaxID=554055 RepID=A0A2P6VDR7_9CHLO|nr:Qc-SNARE SYP7-family [Micractinium conductrix]|eukprot:PSC72240.1 Qc-SNARE SYP7-family [Micractinium conductrix]